MKVTLVFVPPDGGEADYQLDFELPAIPQTGDYISVMRPGRDGTSDFIVRRTWWHLDYPNNELYGTAGNSAFGTVRSIVVECEFAEGSFSSEEHKRSLEMYKNRSGKLKEFDNSAY